jgi:hypothetical protein
MATEIDPVCVVNDAIENGVSVDGIADQQPFVDRDLLVMIVGRRP